MSGLSTNIDVNGLILGTTAVGIPSGTENHQKSTVNEIASELFLNKLYDNNSLEHNSTLIKIAEELKVLMVSKDAIAAIINCLHDIQSLQHSINTYNQRYTSLMSALSSIEITFSERTPHLTKLYKSIFDSDLLLIQDVAEKLHFNEMYDENKVPNEKFGMRFKKQLGKKTVGLYDDDGVGYNSAGVLHPEGTLSKFRGVIGINYAPQLYNNIPYVYTKAENQPQRLRIGTQIEQTFIVPSVPVIFKNFLMALNVEQLVSVQETNYLYINLQKTSKVSTDGLERQAESLRTNALHVELAHIPGVAVVTLPADSARFFQGFSKHEGKALVHNNKEDFVSLNSLFDEICTSIFQSSNDFIIPDSVKDKIFGAGRFDSIDNIKVQLQSLFDSTAKEILGDNYAIEQLVSMEQRQAVYFHFVKHKFTKLIIDKLKPKHFNISCKDAIDRAGVHNLWGILCDRIDTDQSMSLQEFELFLNMPAILVKDRPINDHVNALSNALGQLYFHLPEDKKKLIPWAHDWLEINTCWSVQKHDVSKVFTWHYNDEKAKASYFAYHNVAYNELYIAVSSGNDEKVIELLSDQSKLSIYDNNDIMSDTVLMCAARNGKFDIFLALLEAHDRFESNPYQYPTNPLKNLRSNYGKYKGCILSILFECLETESVDIEINTQNKTQADVCIERYLQSILTQHGIKAKAIGIDYTKYNLADDNGLTPIMHLAKTGNYQMLNKIASMLSEIKQITISDFFAISSTDKKKLIELAVKGGGKHHMLFVETLLTLTKSSEEEHKAAAKEFSSISEIAAMNKVFLQTLLERNPKNDITVAAIALMKQLIISDKNIVSHEWLKCARNAINSYGISKGWIKNVELDPYIKTMLDKIGTVNKIEQIEEAKNEYEMMMMLRIKIEIELKKNQLEFSQVVENIKKCSAASSSDILKNVNVANLKNAYSNSAVLQYSSEENRHDADTKFVNAYKKELIKSITKDPDTNYRLDHLVDDLEKGRLHISPDVAGLVVLAKELSSLETKNGYYLTLYSELTKIFSLCHSEPADMHIVRREQYADLLKEHAKALPNEIVRLFELLFVAAEKKVSAKISNNLH